MPLSFFVVFLVRREPDISSAVRHTSNLRIKYIERGYGRAYRASAVRREAFDGSDSVSIRLAPLIRPLHVHLLPKEKAWDATFIREPLAVQKLVVNRYYYSLGLFVPPKRAVL